MDSILWLCFEMSGQNKIAVSAMLKPEVYVMTSLIGSWTAILKLHILHFGPFYLVFWQPDVTREGGAKCN